MIVAICRIGQRFSSQMVEPDTASVATLRSTFVAGNHQLTRLALNVYRMYLEVAETCQDLTRRSGG